MDLNVGPIESYVPGSSWFTLTQYSDLGQQERISVNLTASNLWLVDESQLNFQDSANPPIVLPGEGQLYQSPVQVSASSPSPTILAVGGSYTPTSSSVIDSPSLETGGNVTFSGVRGEIDSDGADLSSSSGQTIITVIQTESPPSFNIPSNPGSPLFLPGSPGFAPPASSTSEPNLPLSDLPPGTGIVTIPTVPQTTIPPATGIVVPPDLTPGLPPNGSTPPPDVVPAPFDLNTTAGLLLFSVILANKLVRKYTPSRT